jgi:NADH-quinone oxidoreductase subunit L
MAGEQDMRRMGGLKKHLPTTFATMMVGTLAIAGIFPLSGFFSKDEILFRAFLHNKAIWAIAVVTALMTAFYMFRLMSMTFLGAYHGPSWDEASHGSGHAAATRLAAQHGATHPADPLAHGHAHDKAHELTHGQADAHDAHGGHGHGPWHGPHESPRPMTMPLMVLAIGAAVAGFVGIPTAMGGGNAIEHFLEPSFTAQERPGEAAGVRAEAAQEGHGSGEAEVGRGVELGLMGFSVLVALIGIGVAYKFYVTSPEVSDRLATNWSGAHRLLSNKYYVDELYNATVVSGTFGLGRALWLVDRRGVDGVVNGTGWITIISAWFSGLTDRTVVDGVVNLVGRICEEGSFWFRKLQTGLVQNYALLMLFGVFAFVSVYLFVR